MIYRTSDGGRRWSSEPIRGGVADLTSVSSVSFADAFHGWLLRSTPTVASGTELLRTSDGGATWTNLGSPALGNDLAYRVHFSNIQVGWLETLSARPYAYKSVDGGATWSHVPLPAPRGGWPPTGQFLVAVQPTQGIGVIATVASFTPPAGRSGIGASVASYPPLMVRAFDGGVPVYYVYATFADTISNTSWSAPHTKNPGRPAQTAERLGRRLATSGCRSRCRAPCRSSIPGTHGLALWLGPGPCSRTRAMAAFTGR